MLTPEALNALPGWTAVAFFMFWVVKTLLDVIKGKIDTPKSEKTDKPADAGKDGRDLAIELARIEVRVDHMEAAIERMEDRLAEIIKEIGALKGRGERQ